MLILSSISLSGQSWNWPISSGIAFFKGGYKKNQLITLATAAGLFGVSSFTLYKWWKKDNKELQTSESGMSKPIKKNNRYYNSHHDYNQHVHHFLKTFKILIRKYFKPKSGALSLPPTNSEAETPTQLPVVIQEAHAPQSIEPIITWIGHATFLIQIGGFNLLTDPIFGDIKVGRWTLRKRERMPGINLADLPHIDAILISHDHRDHTDTDSLKELQKKFDPMVFVPQGKHKFFKSLGYSKIYQKEWWDQEIIRKEDHSITITFLPAHHWSMRTPLDYRKSLWGSWMITHNGKNIYFAGDTAYDKHFKEIALKFPSIDVALMPIGPTCEEGTENHFKVYHVDAMESVAGFIDLNARIFIPNHYATFGDHTYFKFPIHELHKHWLLNQQALQGKELLFAQCGKRYNFLNFN
jgi:L-ascorbate metabolism protein UlaG (beta-lactamase superfamily)